jgi:hypothetical protein
VYLTYSGSNDGRGLGGSAVNPPVGPPCGAERLRQVLGVILGLVL